MYLLFLDWALDIVMSIRVRIDDFEERAASFLVRNRYMITSSRKREMGVGTELVLEVDGSVQVLKFWGSCRVV